MKTASRAVHAIALFACLQTLWFVAGISPMETARDLIQVGNQYWGNNNGGNPSSGSESRNRNSD